MIWDYLCVRVCLVGMVEQDFFFSFWWISDHFYFFDMLDPPKIITYHIMLLTE